MKQTILNVLGIAVLILFGLAWLGSLLESAEKRLAPLFAEVRREHEEQALQDDLAEMVILSLIQNEGVTDMTQVASPGDQDADRPQHEPFRYGVARRELLAFMTERKVVLSVHEQMGLIYTQVQSRRELEEIRSLAAKAVQP